MSPKIEKINFFFFLRGRYEHLYQIICIDKGMTALLMIQG